MHLEDVLAADIGNRAVSSARANAVTDWLRSRIAKSIGLSAADISPSIPFKDLGLSSSLVVTITEDLSDRSGVPLDVTAMYENPTIEALGRYLLEQQGVQKDT